MLRTLGSAKTCTRPYDQPLETEAPRGDEPDEQRYEDRKREPPQRYLAEEGPGSEATSAEYAGADGSLVFHTTVGTASHLLRHPAGQF